MEKKSVSKNYFYNLFYQILTIVMPLITTPYLSRTLGAESIGIYSYTYSIATYFILFGTMGISLYGQREIAYVQDNKEKRSILFFEIILLKFITMGISILIFSVSFASFGEYKIYYKFLIIELLSQCIDISWFFQGIEEFKKTVIRNSIVKFVFVISIFVFVKSQSDLLKYFFIIGLANFLGNFSLWLYIPKFINKVKIKSINILKHLKPTIILFIPQIAVQIYTVLDKTMIGFIVSDKSEVGFYEQSQKVVKLLLTIVTSLGTVMIPRMASTFAKGNHEQLKKYMYNSFSFVYFLAFPMMAGILLISEQFVPIFFGEGYDKVILLINIIVPIILFIGISNIVGSQYLLTTKKQKQFTISVIVGAVFNFVFNLVVIGKFGATGASIITVIAELLVTATQMYFIRKEINIKHIIFLAKNNIIATFIMILITYGVGKFINLGNFYSVAIKIVVGLMVYIISLYILKDNFFKDIIRKLNDKKSNILNKIRS